QVAEAQDLGRLHPPDDGVERYLQRGTQFVWEELAQPIEFDGRCQRYDRIHVSRASADFANFGGDDQCRIAHHPLPRQHTATAMHELAAVGSGIHAANTIAEPDQVALAQGRILELGAFPCINLKTFVFSYADKLFYERTHVARGSGMNPGIADRLHAK